MNKTYLCIDLKSFYASVECASRGLDPLTTNLVVADVERTEKTICLAVSPSLKKYGIGGRARLFEVVEAVKKINRERAKRILGGKLSGESYDSRELEKKPAYALTYIAATPRMAEYIKVSAKIYSIYLKYIAPEDIHVYSIDEVFMDISSYIKLYNMSAHDLALKMIKEVLSETGITATAGIGSNMYLAKVAMDIDAKHMEADSDGVRISELDEYTYRKRLWEHTPITDFWRVGRGIGAKLNSIGVYTMGDLARLSLKNESLLFDLFGVNAELLIDHAWGYEPTEMKDIKDYKPESNSYGVGQVLHEATKSNVARLILREMVDQMSLDLVEKNVLTNHISISVGYDTENVKNESVMETFSGDVVYDYLGRMVPKPAGGSVSFKIYTSSTKIMCDSVMELFDRIVDPRLTIRRLNVSCIIVPYESDINDKPYQMSIFDDYDTIKENKEKLNKALLKEKNIQEALIDIKKKHGKNSVLKGMNIEKGATMKDRNKQIGGHKA